MSREFDALVNTNTWTLVPPSCASNLIGCRWVFKTKLRADGSIERQKARLVAKGFHQQPEIDYTETFSPVVKPSTIRLVLSIAISHRWSLRQIDIQNAFLHGELTETVFMQQPPGFIDPGRPDLVCKLNKALYGLKQSPRAWFAKLRSWLLSYGFSASQGDPSLFTFHKISLCIFVLVYVDDMVITSSSSDAVDTLVNALGQAFPVTDLGQLSYFLGLELKYMPDGVLMSQTKYITDILTKTNMLAANPISSPMSTSTKLFKFDSPTFDNVTSFRSVVGSLQYLSLTRPDISFSVNKVCQFMREPKLTHWTAVKRILRYLKHSINHGIFFPYTSNFSLHAYSNADWADCLDDHRSTGGFCIFLGCHIISWSSRKQQTVARSSTKAEYKSLPNTTAELI
ncbi:hypothetical protein F2P56_019690 [Juglans regia]|uniref:Reverse transcriptase Ty1/copia-type domain-containing protein n=1 Tax=Juglans regia TaxID=51240 RepID=A0A833U1D2_JUGRE|nr:hypothetical protein F2P56_019690 [Juglans regia]